LVFKSQERPRSLAPDESFAEFNTQMASAVVHEGSPSPMNDGQLPPENCAFATAQFLKGADVVHAAIVWMLL